MQKKVTLILILVVIIGLTFTSTVFSGEILKASNIGKFTKNSHGTVGATLSGSSSLNSQSLDIIGFKGKNSFNSQSFVIMIHKENKIKKGDIFRIEDMYKYPQKNYASASYLKLWTSNHVSYADVYVTKSTDTGYVKITKIGKYYVKGKFNFTMSMDSGNPVPQKSITTKGYFKVKY